MRELQHDMGCSRALELAAKPVTLYLKEEKRRRKKKDKTPNKIELCGLLAPHCIPLAEHACSTFVFISTKISICQSRFNFFFCVLHFKILKSRKFHQKWRKHTSREEEISIRYFNHNPVQISNQQQQQHRNTAVIYIRMDFIVIINRMKCAYRNVSTSLTKAFSHLFVAWDSFALNLIFILWLLALWCAFSINVDLQSKIDS